MKLFKWGLVLACVGGCASVDPVPAPRNEVLVFSKTAGYRHGSIGAGVDCMHELGAELGVSVEASEDGSAFNAENLARFGAVVFLSTTMDVLDEAQQSAFEEYIRGGGGFMGIHAATDTEYDWAWYTGLVGAQFASHPAVQEATLVKTDVDFAATSFLPDSWVRRDEWYNFKAISPAVTNVLMLDEGSYEGGANGAVHPAAWFQEYDGGRSFYTAGGHTEESYSEPLFRRHLKAGLGWVLEG